MEGWNSIPKSQFNSCLKARKIISKGCMYYLVRLMEIDFSVNQIEGVSYLSKIGLRSGYHQLRVKCDDISKRDFSTRYDQYEFLMMSSDLTNAPMTCMNLMNKVLR